MFREQVRSYISERWPEMLLSISIPHGYKRVGHVAILNTEELSSELEEILGQAVLDSLAKTGIQTIAIRTAPTSKTFRTPQIRVIAGRNQTETIHKEHGIKFILDAARITFSAGNLHERKRMIELLQKGFLVDMCCCVGNLSLPAVFHRAPDLTALGIEINPLAYRFLTETIQTNGLSDYYKTILGDSRVLAPKDIADHVLIGCWGADDELLNAAVQVLKQDQGGMIYLHAVQPRRSRDQTKNRVERILAEISSPLKITKISKRRVKWISPSHEHRVTDILLQTRPSKTRLVSIN